MVTAAIIGAGALVGSTLLSKPKSSTTAALSPEQTALTKQQVKVGEFQLGELERQRGLQSQAFGAVEPSLSDFEQFAAEQGGIQQTAATALPGAGQIPGISDPTQPPGVSGGPSSPEQLEAADDELLQDMLDRIRAGGAATPLEIELINSATEQALALGESDITRFLKEGLTQLREELAPQLGLRPGDTPILDRGGKAVAESARQQGQLVRDLRGQQFSARLGFPLQRAEVLGGLNLGQQGANLGTRGLVEEGRQFNAGVGLAGAELRELARQFNAGLGFSGAQLGEQQRQFDFGAEESSRQFQEQQAQTIRDFQAQLKQSAFINRLSLSQAQTGAGLGLAGAGQPNLAPIFRTVSTVTKDSPDVAGALGGAGGLLLGISKFK